MAIIDLPLDYKHPVRGTRLHEALYHICSAMDAYGIASTVIIRGKNTLRPNGKISMKGFVFDVHLYVPFFTVLYADVTKESSPLLCYWLDVKPFGETNPGTKVGLGPSFSFMLETGISQFVKYYETYIPFIREKAHHSIAHFHPVWGFARVVRNAATHGGKISMNDPNFAPVSWYNLTYGPPDNGKSIFPTNLSLPDLFFLMIEMDDALDELGFI